MICLCDSQPHEHTIWKLRLCRYFHFSKCSISPPSWIYYVRIKLDGELRHVAYIRRVRQLNSDALLRDPVFQGLLKVLERILQPRIDLVVSRFTWLGYVDDICP